MKKNFLIALTCGILFLGVVGCGTNIDTDNINKPNINEENLYNNEKTENKYVEDNVINKFFENFKATSNYELTNITKGNIKTKYFAYINGQYCEFRNYTNSSSNNFEIIYGGNESIDVEKIVAVYNDVIKTLDSTISDTDISNMIMEHIKNSSNSFNINNNITVKYYPIVELSYGKSNCRIEITTTVYN